LRWTARCVKKYASDAVVSTEVQACPARNLSCSRATPAQRSKGGD
jgi:hypothetical protein